MWLMGGVVLERPLTSRQSQPTTGPGLLSLTTFQSAASTPDPGRRSSIIFHQAADPGRCLDFSRPAILRPFLLLLLLLLPRRVRIRMEEGGGLADPVHPLLLR